MKKILALILAVVCCMALASCDVVIDKAKDGLEIAKDGLGGLIEKITGENPFESGEDVESEYDLEKAKTYLFNLYNGESSVTNVDYTRTASVKIGDVNYSVSYAADTNLISIVDNGNGTVTVKVSENSGAAVDYKLTATIKAPDGKEITLVFSYTIPEAVSYKEIMDAAYALEAGATLDGTYTLSGKITVVNTPYDEGYKNVSVTIVVDGDGRKIQAYRLKGEGADTIDVGDTITVTGSITNFGGTIEFAAGCELVKVVVGEHTNPDVLTNVDEIFALIAKLNAGDQTEVKCALTGEVKEINTAYDANYKNITFTIECSNGQSMNCYRVKGDEADKIKVGDTVTVTGFITNYNGTIEFAAGSIASDRVAGQGGEEEPPIEEDIELGTPDASLTFTSENNTVFVDAQQVFSANGITFTNNQGASTTKITNYTYDPAFSVRCYKNSEVVISYTEPMTRIVIHFDSYQNNQYVPGDTFGMEGAGFKVQGATLIIDPAEAAASVTFNCAAQYRVLGVDVYTGELTNKITPKEEEEDPTFENAQALMEAVYALKAGETLGEYTVTGIVTEITDPYSDQYKNVTFMIDVDGVTGDCKSILVFRAKGDNAATIAVGDAVTITGTFTHYKHSDGSDGDIEISPANIDASAKACAHHGGEATCKAQAVCEECGQPYGDLADHSFNDQDVCIWCGVNKADLCEHEGGTATCKDKAICDKCHQAYGELGDHNFAEGVCTVCGAFDPDITDAQIVALVYALADGKTLGTANDLFTLTGTIDSFVTAYNPNTGKVSFNMTVAGKSIQAYGVVTAEGTKSDLASGLKYGDKVTVKGSIKNYKGTYEFNGGTIEAVENLGQNPTYVDEIAVINAAYELGKGLSLPELYTLSGKITKIVTAAKDGIITVNMTVTGTDKTIQCYKMAGTDTLKVEDLKVEDLITVKGIVKNYNGTIEMTDYCVLQAVTPACVHEGGSATCQDLAVCEHCGQPYGKLAAHSYKDGKCIWCGADEPAVITGTTVEANFADINGFSSWKNSYVEYTDTLNGVTISLKASKQTGTITDMPVSKGQPITLSVDGDIKFVSLTFKQWGSKAQSVTIQYSLDGETYVDTAIKATELFGDDEGTVSVDLSKVEGSVKYVKVTFGSQDNQIGFQSFKLIYDPAQQGEGQQEGGQTEGGQTEGGQTEQTGDTVIKFNLGENGKAEHSDSTKESTSYTETVGDYTLTLADMSKVYAGSRDAAGNGCLKCGSGKGGASFSFTVPDDVKSVVIYIAGYKAKTDAVYKINGVEYTLNQGSDSGEYIAVTVDTSVTKTVTVEYGGTGDYRCMINEIDFVIPKENP